MDINLESLYTTNPESVASIPYGELSNYTLIEGDAGSALFWSKLGIILDVVGQLLQIYLIVKEYDTKQSCKYKIKYKIIV